MLDALSEEARALADRVERGEAALNERATSITPSPDAGGLAGDVGKA